MPQKLITYDTPARHQKQTGGCVNAKNELLLAPEELKAIKDKFNILHFQNPLSMEKLK